MGLPYLKPVTFYKVVASESEIFVQVTKSDSCALDSDTALGAAADTGIEGIYARETDFKEVLAYRSEFMPQCSIAQVLIKTE